jgi:hypothetical protein
MNQMEYFLISGLLLGLVVGFMATLNQAENMNLPWRSVLTVGLVIATIFAFLPTHDKILDLKISKIKNEAVSQENINKGVDEIKRISRKLECKYLGGSDCETK